MVLSKTASAPSRMQAVRLSGDAALVSATTAPFCRHCASEASTPSPEPCVRNRSTTSRCQPPSCVCSHATASASERAAPITWARRKPSMTTFRLSWIRGSSSTRKTANVMALASQTLERHTVAPGHEPRCRPSPRRAVRESEAIFLLPRRSHTLPRGVGAPDLLSPVRRWNGAPCRPRYFAHVRPAAHRTPRPPADPARRGLRFRSSGCSRPCWPQAVR